MVRARLRSFVIASLLLPVVLSGCNTTRPEASQQITTNTAASSNKSLKVLTTFLPVYLFTKAVAGDAATVDILIQPGTEVHEYQSTPADVQAIAQADVVVKNGLGVEEFLDDTIKSAENKNLRVIDASRGIQVIDEALTVGSTSGEAEHDHANETTKTGEKTAGHNHESGNPHVWLDPVLAKQQVENIRDGLIAADPTNQATYQANAAAYIQQLSKLNDQFEQRLKGYRDRTFVTFHDAFPYLAKRYQLQQVAVVEIPEDQLSPSDVQKAVATVKQYKVKALFSEPGVDNKLLSSLSSDLNLTLRPLDSLEAGQLDPNYYFTAMNTNLQTLETAFK
ncbi:zinc ABC transporter substrate-binding protein [Leptolyngbya sp. FACHB-36]|uniref:metal ABC transporter solute-binding protein, Zn/Mn family n=1 Tax=Leptolyngbya sp. FACHB-36 TaxID=2692808 RepID=UPI0016810AF9|nr:zinc ABC transporter substrate-binding protein [Leptolyngbya sp. FACHB-36]MBD2018700.1 zinc ABC transporter substrate-binding protein [Leptolyngbya sp. FACHB-36]